MNIHKTSHTSAGSGRTFLLCIIFLLWAATTTTTTIPTAGAHVTVHVCNNLTYVSETFWVHCQSCNTDIGARYVTAGHCDYAFDFDPDAWRSTICHVERDSGYHADIAAWQNGDYNNAPITWCAQNDNVTGWKRDAIYYTYEWLPNY
ncbi:unnamed protein product [Linum tenue]|uniref:Uncharacterized protein n=1 Tax=Linum tenue TaxID=586396 RepID=A0AAV0PFT9_9ROSI|nr:unnamed protein product [Linum tenue]